MLLFYWSFGHSRCIVNSDWLQVWKRGYTCDWIRDMGESAGSFCFVSLSPLDLGGTRDAGALRRGKKKARKSEKSRWNGAGGSEERTADWGWWRVERLSKTKPETCLTERGPWSEEDEIASQWGVCWADMSVSRTAPEDPDQSFPHTQFFASVCSAHSMFCKTKQACNVFFFFVQIVTVSKLEGVWMCAWLGPSLHFLRLVSGHFAGCFCLLLEFSVYSRLLRKG